MRTNAFFFCIIETSFCIILGSMMQNNYFIFMKNETTFLL